MTSDEILVSIQSLTGQSRILNLKLPNQDDPYKYDLRSMQPFLILGSDKETSELKGIHSIDEHLKAEDDTKEKITKIIEEKYPNFKTEIIFNPYSVPLATWRWILLKPDSVNTKNLLFSTFGVRGEYLDFHTASEWVHKIIEDVYPFMLKCIKAKGLSLKGERPPIRMGRPRNTIPTPHQYAICVSEREYGTANYSCNRSYSSLNFNEIADDIINMNADGADMSEMEDVIREYIRQNYNNEDPDWDDHDYDNEECENTDYYEDDSDHSSIVEEILN